MNYIEVVDKIEKIIGKSYYRDDRTVIFNTNSLELQKELNFKFINSTITSPPYNIGKEYENNLDVNDYIQWISEYLNSIYKLTVDNGNLMFNVGYLEVPNIAKAIPIPYLIHDKLPFYLNQEIIWNYGAGVSCKKYLSPRNEKLLWCVKDSKKYTFNLDFIRDSKDLIFQVYIFTWF